MTLPFAEILRFGSVGALATAIHSVVYLIALDIVSPQIANIAGFVCAVCASYFGHRHFSFRTDPQRRAPARRAAFRFGVTSGLGFVLNAGFVALTTTVLMQPAWVAVGFIGVVTPILTYCLLKFWAFQPPDHERQP